ncbi:MAG: hypothetical protein M3Z08_14140 [Chloroflexota bacterium]|nr:hypothetical protein [Chloroflexota bacterium]
MWLSDSALVIDRHVIAGISIAGTVCDVMGGLYLAYDLLGGNNGPLRTLTRVVTYTLIFCVGYGLPFGLLFGPLKGIELALVVGVGLGGILGLEYTHVTLDRAQNQQHAYDQWLPFLFGFLRGAVFGLAGGLLIEPLFGLLFGLLSGIGLITVYAFRLSPSDAYQPHVKPRLRPHELIASAMRGSSTALAGIIAALLTHGGSGALGFGLTFGLVAGTVSAIVSIFSPFVEWWADHLPTRRLGAFGTMILLLGLILQSIQYWVVLLNIGVQ